MGFLSFDVSSAIRLICKMRSKFDSKIDLEFCSAHVLRRFVWGWAEIDAKDLACLELTLA